MDKKALSLPVLTSLEIGNMIGTGIYILPALLIKYGTVSLIAWVYTSIGALFIALTFTSMNRRFPKTGGPYAFAKAAFGNLGGFIIACTYWFTNLASLAGVAVASIGYLGFIFPSLNANSHDSFNPYAALGAELAILWIFTIINIIGLRTAGKTQLILTILKVAPLLIISFLGLSHVDLSHFNDFHFGQFTDFSQLDKAATIIFWAFIGIEAATVPAENTKGPNDIYKATIYGTLITAGIYILSTFVLMGMIPAAQLQNSQFPFADAGTILFGQYGALLVVLCAFISGIGTLNACALLQAQVVFAAARDNLFPKRFSKLSHNDSPVAAQLLGSTIVSLSLFMTIQPSLLKQFDIIALFASLLCLITYFAVALAELKFLAQEKKLRHLIVSKSWLIALIGILYISWMISSFTRSYLLSSVLLIVICIGIYFTSINKHVRAES